MSTVLQLCNDLPERTLGAGEALIEEGKKAGGLFVLVDGAVEILKGEVRVNTVSKPGAVLGEVAVLLGSPHMATVKTLEESKFLVAKNPKEFLASHPDMVLHMARLLAQRLSHATGYLVDAKKQSDQHAEHVAMVDNLLEALVEHYDDI